MCVECWQRYGATASPIHEDIRCAAVAVKAVYDEHETGGQLHVVVDDWNLSDATLTFCADRVETPAERDCWATLWRLTEQERATVLALAEGFVTDETKGWQ